MEANFIHPKYKDARSYLDIIEKSDSIIVARIEYPDGVIVIFTLTVDGISLNCNRHILFKEENGETIIEPILEEPNFNFKDR